MVNSSVYNSAPPDIKSYTNINNTPTTENNQNLFSDERALEEEIERVRNNPKIMKEVFSLVACLSTPYVGTAWAVQMGLPVIGTVSLGVTVLAGLLIKSIAEEVSRDSAGWNINNPIKIAVSVVKLGSYMYTSFLATEEFRTNERTAKEGQERFLAEVKAYEVKSQPKEQLPYLQLGGIFALLIGVLFIINKVRK